jgi:putative copper export protein
LVNAFSPVALASAAIAVVTGVVATWLHVGRIPNLWGTRYGVTLLLKLATLSIVVVTGWYNWKVVQPALGTDASTTTLHRAARVELATTLLVLLVTAVLVATPTALDSEM